MLQVCAWLWREPDLSVRLALRILTPIRAAIFRSLKSEHDKANRFFTVQHLDLFALCVVHCSRGVGEDMRLAAKGGF